MHLQNLEDDLIGVKRIDASYKKMSMEVEFDETKLSVEQIIQAANALGYHPELKVAWSMMLLEIITKSTMLSTKPAAQAGFWLE